MGSQNLQVYFVVYGVAGLLVSLTTAASTWGGHASTLAFAAGKGFGKKQSKSPPEKTYGREAVAPIRDVLIDSEGAMQEFFAANEEWFPLFRSMANHGSVPAMSFLGGSHQETIDFHEESAPWKRLQGIPQLEEDKQVLAHFLDSMHQSFLDIPVHEGTKEDEFDLQFLEEGRRMLVVSRFHVLRENSGGSVESRDALFSTCWNELYELRHNNREGDAGCLIVLPDYELADLRRFADINLIRPLEWLGIHADFEVASMERGSPAIRMIHKLSDMPSQPWREEEDGSTNTSGDTL